MSSIRPVFFVDVQNYFNIFQCKIDFGFLTDLKYYKVLDQCIFTAKRVFEDYNLSLFFSFCFSLHTVFGFI